MRKLLVSLLALVPAALISLPAAGQVAPDRGPRAPSGEPVYKYQAFAGVGYTSLNQVNQSRYGLIGADLGITRNWGRYFGLTADGSFYPHSVASGNPGTPSVDMVLFGPEVHGQIVDRVTVFVHALLGGEHTGGENQTPKISFAGGAGGGVEYALGPRLSLRLWGDDIASSFSVASPTAGDSPHMRRNSRASFGVAYRF